MARSSLVPGRQPGPRASSARRGPDRGAKRNLTGGGTDGNEQLTTIIGTILLVPLAVIGVTILRIGQLLWLHLFLGLLLIGPVVLKMASTGYRFARYYTRDLAYRRKGPPAVWLRLIAPVIVLTTLIVFTTGVALLFVGLSGRGELLLIHKVSFIVWVAFTALHVLGHLPRVFAWRRSVSDSKPRLAGTQPGAAGRWIAVVGAVVGGVVLAIALLPQFSAWTRPVAVLHHQLR